MPVFFLKALSVLKQYWYVFALVAFGFWVRNWLDGQRLDFSKTLQEMQKIHEVELSAIKAADDKRIKAYEENVKRLEERLAQIESQYVEAQKKLNEKKKQEIHQILVDTKDDPVELAQKFADVTGFKVEQTP